MVTKFAEIVDEVRSLDVEDKIELMNLLYEWVGCDQRERIFINKMLTEKEFQSGKSKSGTLEDLRTDLYEEN